MILDLITIALYSSLGTFENLIIPLSLGENKRDVWKTYAHGFQMASLVVTFQGIFNAYVLSYFDE